MVSLPVRTDNRDGLLSVRGRINFVPIVNPQGEPRYQYMGVCTNNEDASLSVEGGSRYWYM